MVEKITEEPDHTTHPTHPHQDWSNGDTIIPGRLKGGTHTLGNGTVDLVNSSYAL